jgi:hypothetical protein
LSSSFIDVGVSKPADYSKEKIEELVKNAKGASCSGDERTPDIIFVQLESFFDVNLLKNVTYSENPISFYNYLETFCPHGYLTMPTVGAGTARTEFEILSGMSLEYFGFCEYPYKTILRKTACESICYNLSEYGYKSHAIHNNDATFYSRNTVFSALGFDTFTSIEYMPNVTYNAMGWAEDCVLTEEIVKALDSTKGSDFVFTITVQSHGKYYKIPASEGEHVITASGLWSEDDQASFEYFLRQLYEVDRFIEDLVNTLKARGEPVVLVLYGDHQPTFGYTEADLENGSYFQTGYVIWSNIELDAENRDLSAYQLSAYVTGLLGLDGGVINEYHHACMDYENQEEYLNGLWSLQYDALYGEKLAYGGVYPYDFSELTLGVEPVKISGFEINGNRFYVYGENFTAYSRVCINGSVIETEFVDEHTLVCSVLGKAPKESDLITVVQISALSESVSRPLSSSEAVEY